MNHETAFKRPKDTSKFYIFWESNYNPITMYNNDDRVTERSKHFENGI